jgi:hypothetical protein
MPSSKNPFAAKHVVFKPDGFLLRHFLRADLAPHPFIWGDDEISPWRILKGNLDLMPRALYTGKTGRFGGFAYARVMIFPCGFSPVYCKTSR